MSATVQDPHLATRLAHLQRANQVRGDKARIRREVFALGSVESAHRLAELLDQGDERVMLGRVGDVLRWVRGVGGVKARMILRAADVTNSSLRFDALSPRQRQLIAACLRSGTCDA